MEYEKQKVVIHNIEHLLKIKNIKVSDAEKAVSVSSGYFSRLKKEEGKAFKLSYDLLSRIADYLKVSMDYLMLNSFENTSDIQSLIDFFESLYRMSENGLLVWNTRTLKDINHPEFPSELLGPVSTTIEWTTEYDQEIYPEHIYKFLADYIDTPQGTYGITWIGCLSLKKGHLIDDTFFTKENISGDFYYTYIEDIKSTLYLYRVEYADTDGKKKLSDVIEAYLVNGKENNFLCNSVEWGNYIASKLQDFYKLAKNKCSCTRLDEGAKKLINQFNASNK